MSLTPAKARISCVDHPGDFGILAKLWLYLGVGDERMFLQHSNRECEISNLQLRWSKDPSTSRMSTLYKELQVIFSGTGIFNANHAKNIKHRIALTHFRTRNNLLFVETGSWGSQTVPYEERHRADCNSRDIEDEYHFLLTCTLYSELRNRYIPKYYRFRPSVYKFVWLMQTEYSPLLCRIDAFVLHTFEIRNQISYNKWYCIAVHQTGCWCLWNKLNWIKSWQLLVSM